MNEQPSHGEWEQNDEKLSDDDIAALQAFEERDAWITGPLQAQSMSSSTFKDDLQSNVNEDDARDDMLMVFSSEIDEDIGRLRHALSLLEQDDVLDMSRFTSIRRIAHKIRGTAGSVDCKVIEAIGSILEEIVDQTTQHKLFPLIGISVLVQAVHALELTLQGLLDTGQESLEALTNLENDLTLLDISHTSSSSLPTTTQTSTQPVSQLIVSPEHPAMSSSSRPLTPRNVPLPTSSIALLRVDAGRFQQLIQDTEQLAEQRTPLENAQAQLQDALQELHLAQANLQLQATSLDRVTSNTSQSLSTEAQVNSSISSLIARVLNHTAQQTEDASTRFSHANHQLRHPNPRPVNSDRTWDALEVTHYTDLDERLRAISETISGVSLAEAHVKAAYSHLNIILQQYITQATTVRDKTLLLRQTPVSILADHLHQVIAASSSGQSQHTLSFEVTGERTELDSTILEVLTQPLIHLLQTCLADILLETIQPEGESDRIWLRVQSMGNEVKLELGFSMTVQGGALETIQDAVQQISGSLALQRNEHGGVSFLLHVPRTQGTIRGLLVRVGTHQAIVPFSQVQRIDDEKHAELDITYYLRRLMDVPREEDTKSIIMPILVLPRGTSRLVAGVLVDEVLTDVEVVVKPLPGYLQRPGITGTTIDGNGNVQLVLNLQKLIRHYNTFLRHVLPEQDTPVRSQTTTPRVLVADDSFTLRQSLLQTLQRAHYETAEASDGMEALEQLTNNPPDIFLLDMEMPNLSGYDVLSIMHLYHELTNVKVIMLTSLSSEKHRRHAMELGAHAYLTKPYDNAILLDTIAKLLG